MSVVNCRVKNIRPQYQNLKEWMADDDNIYIGRAGVVFINSKRFPKCSSAFCNPYKIGTDGDRKTVLKKYKTYIKERLESDPDLVDELISMEGKNLGCWCAPEPCHGHILLRLIEFYMDLID
jgi:hypothetical protein